MVDLIRFKTLLTYLPQKLSPPLRADNLRYAKNLTADCAEFSSKIPFLKSGEENIKNAVKKALSDSSAFLGKGNEGCVYRLKNTNYLVKIKNGKEISLKDKLSFDVTDEETVNRVVAKIGENIQIRQYLPGNPIDAAFCLENLNPRSVRDCLEDIYNAARLGMRHDSGGANILFDSKTGKTIPFDFYKNKPGSKHPLVDNLFRQFFPAVKTSDDAERLLKMVSGGFIDLVKENKINKTGSRLVSVDLKAVKDLFLTNPNLRSKTHLAHETEQKLQQIMTLKIAQGLSPAADKEFLTKINELAKEFKH